MHENPLRVSVVAYPDRKFLMMRYRDPETGKQVARTTGTANRRDADRIAAKWEADLQSGRYAPKRKVSWDTFREAYERDVLPSLALNTGQLIGTVFNCIEDLVSPNLMSDLTAARLSRFQAQLREGGRSEATIRTYLAHLVSALKWAADIGYLSCVPKVQSPKRAKRSKLMKGRPITAEEFSLMLAATKEIVGANAAASWRYLLEGLWWSGLRLSEALDLYWDRSDRLQVDYRGARPMLLIPAELEKGNQDRLLPMAPEFAEFLSKTSARDRQGRVFKLVSRRGISDSFGMEWVSEVLSRVGAAADIKVNVDAKTGKVKYASAHDLRRSFGERWAERVMPQVLQQLMRHESIETTMKYYVGRNAQRTADALWLAYGQQRAPTEGNTLGNSCPNSGASTEETTS